MFQIAAPGIAVYVYRSVPNSAGLYEFLQLRRVDSDALSPGSWQIVYGGSVEGEKAYESAYRELLEETGLVPAQMHLVQYIESFYFRPENRILMIPVFCARVSSDDAITLNQEHDAYRWIAEADIPQNFVWRSQREAINCILETLRQYEWMLPQLAV